MCRCGNRNYIIAEKTCRVGGRAIVIISIVSRTDDVDASGSIGLIDRKLHRTRIVSANPAIIGYLGTHHGCIFQCAERMINGTASGVVQKTQRHELGIPVDSGHPNFIVSRSGDRSGDVCAVPMAVQRVRITAGKIPPVDIVDVAIVIIVDAVSRYFTGVGPDVVCKVGVGVVNSGIDHTDNNIGAPGLQIPGFWCVNIGIYQTPCLSGVVESPHILKLFIIGNSFCNRECVVWFDKCNPWIVGP